MLLDTRSLSKSYTSPNLFSKSAIIRAVDNVDLKIDRGTATALVGASGSGKSTLARCLAGLEPPTEGVIRYQGIDTSSMTKAQRLAFRRNIQLVFQDAAGSINPRFTAAAAISEPLRIARTGNPGEQKQAAIYWMEQVGLSAALAARPALELSGGERQRLSIARSLISNPEVIIFDESFAALDVALATCLLKLLDRLRESHCFTYLYIGHNLALLARACSQVAVMHKGRIVEKGLMRNFLCAPTHAYSRELVQAVPRLPEGWLT